MSSRHGKIVRVLLLGLLTIAMGILGGHVAFKQLRPRTLTQAPLFTAIDLNPPEFVSSEALGVSGREEVGYGELPSPQRAWPTYHALLWHGSAATVADLHPRGYVSSEALGISGGQQVGWGGGSYTGDIHHALVWSGSAASVVDLHPKGFTSSEAFGTNGQEQVGRGLPSMGSLPGGPFHALLWRSSAGNVVDLNSAYTSSSQALGIAGDQIVGSGTIAVPRGRDHALLWRTGAANVVDLHPGGFVESQAYGISGVQQLGSGVRDGNCAGPPPSHPLLWRGSAGSAVEINGLMVLAISGGEMVGSGSVVLSPGNWSIHAMLWRSGADGAVDLHAFLPPGFAGSRATSIDANGDIVGYAEVPAASRYSPATTHAFLWKRNVNVKPAHAPTTNNGTPQDLAPPKPLFISSTRLVSYILTDPQGRRTGVDPVHNMSYQDIPGALYHTDICDNDETTVLEMPDHIPGRYILDVFGNGNVRIDVSAWTPGGHWVTHSFDGAATPGVPFRFTIPGEITGFASPFPSAAKAWFDLRLIAQALSWHGRYVGDGAERDTGFIGGARR